MYKLIKYLWWWEFVSKWVYYSLRAFTNYIIGRSSAHNFSFPSILQSIWGRIEQSIPCLHLSPPCSQTDLHPSICPWFSKPCLVAGGGGTGGLVAHFMAGWLESQRGGATASGSLALPAQAPELRAASTRGGPHPEFACSALWNGFTPHADQTKLSFSSKQVSLVFLCLFVFVWNN